MVKDNQICIHFGAASKAGLTDHDKIAKNCPVSNEGHLSTGWFVKYTHYLPPFASMLYMHVGVQVRLLGIIQMHVSEIKDPFKRTIQALH